MNERILITGGAGFIGANLAAALVKRPGIDVVVLDDFSFGDWKNLLHVDCEVRAGCISAGSLLDEIADGAFSAILHQGAISDTTVLDQQRMLEINTNAFAAMLEASCFSGTRMIYASSAATYGNAPAPNTVGGQEEAANIYGFSKLSMDRIAQRWYDRHPSVVIGLRYFNVYGPGEAHKGRTASMILQLYNQIKAGKQPRLFKHGEQQRDFVYIRDVIAANLAALEAPRSGVCNVGSGKARCFNDIVQNLETLLNQKLDVDFIDNPYSFYQNHTEAEMGATRDLLGWEPQWSLEDGMAEYISLLEKNLNEPVEAIA
ncbi:MAG: ADP-glyceromanno-heptose 6-epimerase [Zetaproteobacteria bacterium CG12_big_fil_rev_8_21_14_0_65_55_1124]|nr:MAG: ADP-glyceromanno-heptose 6-epimerase [Zetaproteobacteria bacterium CG1_02_55_237]PIS19132.1 MAG: ADP-glyceromanno-heptose 6-epimerase [Zetaproteobacteria bacterium CG08_land_8_20_14_0_20_55_17]PIW43828.1 MAG: ADP-glyceromanno-heptose 6-epimerase [Zetaproteobacteria bacterium CG12_big_fil_rev_8_21_14_0_65_55_1124]PIY52974.1 MAG: ADP-glyceromanno-heptose 6-epimerase [Zetaproteobacteria bacterium CG_4_10_14_0_8_um_filter_55_43]PIZ37607.1 MAG: ADP-glyceromanno-heptose 6-epimerase [Zetaprote